MKFRDRERSSNISVAEPLETPESWSDLIYLTEAQRREIRDTRVQLNSIAAQTEYAVKTANQPVLVFKPGGELVPREPQYDTDSLAALINRMKQAGPQQFLALGQAPKMGESVSPAITQAEKNILAWTILGEAAGEGHEGMAAVMHVIQNRSRSSRYPDNLADVATQPKQFSTWNSTSQGGNNPKGRWKVGSEKFNEALGIVDEVLGGGSPDPTGGATHFYSTAMMGEPYWWKSEAPGGGKQIGNHRFALRGTAAEPAKSGFSLGSVLGMGYNAIKGAANTVAATVKTYTPTLTIFNPSYVPTNPNDWFLEVTDTKNWNREKYNETKERLDNKVITVPNLKR